MSFRFRHDGFLGPTPHAEVAADGGRDRCRMIRRAVRASRAQGPHRTLLSLGRGARGERELLGLVVEGLAGLVVVEGVVDLVGERFAGSRGDQDAVGDVCPQGAVAAANEVMAVRVGEHGVVIGSA